MTTTTCPHGIEYANFCSRCDRYRRDRFAAAALTGFAACPKCHENVEYDAARFAHSAVDFADALVAALDKPVPSEYCGCRMANGDPVKRGSCAIHSFDTQVQP